MYEIVITDSTGSLTLPELEVPLTVTPLSAGTDVTVLSNDIYTDTAGNIKRFISHTWSYLTEEQFNELYAYWERQQSVTYQYPRITITKLGITDMVAKMSINPQNIIDQCGTVSGVTVSFRESKQNP